MAWTTKGLYVHTFQEALRATAITGTGGLDFRLATWKIALHGDTLTDGASPVDFSAADTTWVNTGEISGTGWAAGGVVLNVAASGATSVVPTVAEGSAGQLRYDWTNDLAVSGTTLTAAKGCIIYADNITAPADLLDAMAVAVNFGATYSTNNGIFGIQPDPLGIFQIDLVP